MPFRVVGYNKPIDDSSLPAMKQSVLDMVQWTTYEFNQIAAALLSTEADKVWNTAPPKPRTGTQAYADGTNWNPGSGEGFYEYTSAGTWVPMFASASVVPSGSVMLFYMASAPTGWTKLTTQNDKALRVVSGSGGVSGGTNAFSTVMAQTVVGNHALSIAELPSHSHTTQTYLVDDGNTAGSGVSVAASLTGSSGSTNATGSGTAHNHTITMAIQYIDMILASKN